LALKLTRDLPGTRVCDFTEALAAGVGVKVFPDARVWETEVRFARKTAGLSVKQLSALLKAKSIELVVDVSPDGQPPERTLPESVARQPKKPPGLPELNWAIYLLRRKE
jgi:hypothetical protein